MGLKKFFKKAGAWVKDKFHKAKNVVTKFAKPVVGVVKKVTDFIGKTPIAPILNTVTGGIYGMVKKGIDLIPDGSVKDNVNKFTDQAKRVSDTAISKADEYQHKANQVIDKGKQWVNAGQRMGGLIKQQTPKLVASVKPLVP
jgi:hypothetical protein